MATAILRGSTAMAFRLPCKPVQFFSWVYCLARPREGLIRRAGGIDARPVEGADVVALLHSGDRRVGIGGIAAARAQAGEAGVRVSPPEKSAQKPPPAFVPCPPPRPLPP